MTALKLSLALDHLLFSLGLFSLLPVLPVLLETQDPRAGPAFVGAGLFGYTAAAGVAALLVSPWLPRLRYSTAASGALVLSAVGFGLLPYVHRGAVLLALLVLAGLGYSVHLVLTRVLIAELVHDDVGRQRIYSILQIAVNGAAALGPFVAVFLYASGDGRPLLGLVAGCYLLAAVTLMARLPRRLRPPPTTGGWPIGRATAVAVVRDGLSLRVVIATTVGAFLYAQFYSAFTIMVARQIGSLPLRAILLAVPAVAIVVTQTGITSLVTRSLRRGVRPFTVLAAGTLVFGVAMLTLGIGPWIVVGASAGVIIFSLAEMLFTPTVSTAFAALPLTSQLESFNLRQVAWTLGEALGSWCGGSVFLFLLHRGDDRVYWLALAGATLAGMPIVMLWGAAADRCAATG